MNNVDLDRLKNAILKPGLDKHLLPLVMYRGAVTLGQAHRTVNLMISAMEHNASLSDLTQRLQCNPQYSQLCLPDKVKQGLSLYGFLSRIEDNPSVANNIPGLLDYCRSIGGRRLSLTKVSLETHCRRNSGAGGWREFKSVPGQWRAPRVPSATFVYPFLIHDAGKPEHDLLRRVNAAVPKWLPPDRRADICQDLIVGILCGEIPEDTIDLPTKEMTKRVLKQFPTKYGDLSLDETYGDDDFTIMDTISAEDSIWDQM